MGQENVVNFLPWWKKDREKDQLPLHSQRAFVSDESASVSPIGFTSHTSVWMCYHITTVKFPLFKQEDKMLTATLLFMEIQSKYQCLERNVH